MANKIGDLPKSQGLVSIGQAAAILGVSVDTLRRWDKAGTLKSIRPNGKDRYFSIKDLKEVKPLQPDILPKAKAGTKTPLLLSRLLNKGKVRKDNKDNIALTPEAGFYSIFARSYGSSVFTWFIAVNAILNGISQFLFPGFVHLIGFKPYLTALFITKSLLVVFGTTFLLTKISGELFRPLYKFSTLMVAILFLAQAFMFKQTDNPVNMVIAVSTAIVVFSTLIIKINELLRFMVLAILHAISAGIVFLARPDLFPSTLVSQLISGDKLIFGLIWFGTIMTLIIAVAYGYIKHKLFIVLASSYVISITAFIYATFAISHNLWDQALYSVAIGVFAALFTFEREFQTINIGQRSKVLRSFLTFAMILVVGAGAVFYMQKSFKTYVLEQNSQAIHTATKIITSDVEDTKQTLAHIAQHKELVELMSLETRPSTNFEQLLHNFFIASPTLRRIGLIDQNGKAITIYPVDNSFIGTNLSDRKYFQEIKAGESLAISEGVRPRAQGTPVAIVMATPIVDNQGRFLGALFGSFDLVRLSNKLNEVELGNNRSFIVADQQGKIIVHEDEKYILQPLKTENAPNNENNKAEVRHTDDYDDTGRQSLQSSSTIDTLGWSIIAQQPLTEVTSRNSSIAFIVFLVTMLIAIGSLVVNENPSKYLSTRRRSLAQSEAGFIPITILITIALLLVAILGGSSLVKKYENENQRRVQLKTNLDETPALLDSKRLENAKLTGEVLGTAALGDGSFSFFRVLEAAIKDRTIIGESRFEFQNGDLLTTQTSTSGKISNFKLKDSTSTSAFVQESAAINLQLSNGQNIPLRVIDGEIINGKLSGVIKAQTYTTRHTIVGEVDSNGNLGKISISQGGERISDLTIFIVQRFLYGQTKTARANSVLGINDQNQDALAELQEIYASDITDKSLASELSYDYQKGAINFKSPSEIVSSDEKLVVDKNGSTVVLSLDLSNLEAGLTLDSVDSRHIRDGTIVSSDLSDQSVTIDKIHPSIILGGITSVNAGTGLTGGGLSGAITLDVKTGAGLAISDDEITLDATTTASTATINSNSGLEVSSDGLRLLGGCSDDQILKWDDSAELWRCDIDNNSGSSITVQESDGSPSVNPTTTLQFLASDFTVTDLGGGIARVNLGSNIFTTANYAASLDPVYVNVGESPLAGDISGSFSGALIINPNSVALGPDTTGDYVASFVAGGGLIGDATGEGSTPTLAVVSANGGIVINSNDIALDATVAGDALSATTSSGSGLEILSSGLTLLQGCANNEILKWNETTDVWACAADADTGVTDGDKGDITVTGGGLTWTIDPDSVTLGSDTTGNYVATITNGSGISGSSASEGGTPTISLGPLTADWNQTGAFDLVLNNASSELKILESLGGTFYATLDAGDLAADATYTLSGASGTLLSSANYSTTLDSVYVNVGESPAAGDVTGSFSGGLTLNANTVNDSELVDALSYTGALTVSNLTIADTNISFSGGDTAFDITGAATRVLSVLNSTTSQVTNFDLSDGELLTNGISRLTNAGALQNISGLTVSSGTVSLPSGQIDNSELANSSVTVTAGTGLSGGGAVALGGSVSLATTLGISIDTTEIDLNTITLPDVADSLTLDANLTFVSDSATNDYKLVLDNSSTGDVANILSVTTSGTGATIATAFDLSDSDIGTALALGGNDVTVGGVTISSSEFAVLDAGITESEVSGEIEAVTAGNGLTGGGTQDSVTLDIASANGGIVANSDNIALTVAASANGLSTTTSSGSGLEILSSGLSLLQGCADNEILKWNETTDVWACATDAAGGVTDGDKGDITVTVSGATWTIDPDSVALGTDTTGNYVATITAGNGISGSSSSEGGTPTIALGALTADWSQTGAFDIVLNNSASELKLLESGATPSFFAILDAGDLSADATYTLSGSTGTILTDANYNSTLDSVYVNIGESPAAGDITGSFSGGLTVGLNAVALGTDTTGDYVASFTAGNGLTGSATGEGSTPTLAVGAGTCILANTDDVALNQNCSVAWTADHTWTLAETEDLTINISISGTNAGQGEIITLTNSSTSGNQYGLYIDNAASTGTSEALLVLDNSDTDTAVSAAIQIVNAGGGFTNIIDNAGILISGTELNILDGGIDETEVTGDIEAVTAGNGLTGGGTADSVTLDVASANGGIVANANDIALDATVSGDALSTTTSSGSGLEILASGLTLLQGCADTEILKWNETTDVWACGADSAGGISDGDKGDITVTASGATWTIDNDVVTFAKFQNVTTDRILGRDTTGTGDVEELTISGGLEFTGSGGLQTSAFTGDVTKAAGGTALTIAANSVDLTTDTAGNYVASANTNVLTGLTGGSSGSEGAALTLSLDYSQALTGDVGLAANAAVFGQSGLVFEGATANTVETFISITDPTSTDKTITIPDRSGTVALSGDTFTGDVTATLETDGSTILTIAGNSVALTTDTTGDYVASFTAGGGLTGDATGEGSTPTIAVASANGGIVINANDIALTLATALDGRTGTSSASGLSVYTEGLSLLQGCSDTQILKWVESTDTWDCAADATGGGGSDLDGVYDTDTDKILNVDSITGLFFDLTTTGDFSIRDGTSAFATFSNTGAITFTLDATDNPAFLLDNDGSSNATIRLDGTGDFVIADGATTFATFDDSGGLIFAPVSGQSFSATVAGAGTFTQTISGTGNAIINLSSTGDFVVQDNGSTFFTLSDTGALDITLDSTDNPALTVTNNGSSNVIYNLAGTGDFVIQDAGVAWVTFADDATGIINLAGSSTTAFQFQDAGTVIFAIDTTNSRVYVGNPTADATGALLVLDTKNTSGDPTGVNGAMYYNSSTNKFRCFENSAWKDCDTTGGGGSGITRIAGSSGAAGADITLQRLTSNSADVTTTTLSSSVMSTTTVGAGTWKFRYTLVYQTAATTTGIGFGINHTGASSSLNHAMWYHITTGGAAATGVGDNVAATVAGQMAEGKSGTTINAIIGSASAGVAAANTNHMAILEGTLIVTNSGTLELKISSEVSGSAVRIISNSLLELTAF